MMINMPTLPSDAAAPPAAVVESTFPLLVRSSFGGALMGLANLVPGISGGTMLLAVGIYPRFIAAIGEVTTLRFRRDSLVSLAAVVGAALVAIGALAGVVKDLVVDHRWVMYSLFIGLTLGGVPLVWRLIGAARTTGTWVGAAVGFAGMVAVGLAQARGADTASREGVLFLLLAGVAGASAMILPGISGGYLLLLLGAYVPILAGIDSFVQALRAVQVGEALAVGVRVILPVGVGVAVGIVIVSNILRWALKRFPQPTLGVLLGLLLGAVAGLWPFQQGVPPQAGARLKGQEVTADAAGGLVYAASGKPVKREDYPTAPFHPTPGQVAAALSLVAAGFSATLLVDRLGGRGSASSAG